MRRLFPIPPAVGLVALLAVPAATPAAPPPGPEWVPGTRMTQAVEAALLSVQAHTGSGSGYGFDAGVCVLAGFLQHGEELTFNRPFEKNERYVLIGGGDSNADDLDLTVHDSSGAKVAADTDDDAAPTVQFKAPKTGTYKITLSLQKSREKSRGAFAALFFLRKGGYSLSTDEVKYALEKLVDACAEVSRAVSKKVWYQSGNNQWSLYGAILEPDESQMITGVRFGLGERMLLAAGDKSAEDVDLAVLNDEGEVVLKDKTREPLAFLKFAEDEVKARQVQFKNVKSKKGRRSLVLTAVLRLDP